MIQIKRIPRTDPLYTQEVDLRQRVLLDPINYTMAQFEVDYPGFEDRFEHIVAIVDHPKGARVIGCVCLLPDYPKKGIAKLMQMAVDPQRQGEGIGRLLVAELERRALGELKIKELFCHARDDASGFYERMNWKITGKPFQEAGIKHFKMTFKA